MSDQQERYSGIVAALINEPGVTQSQAAAELHVAVDLGGGADEHVDAAAGAYVTVEHRHSRESSASW